MLRHYVYLMATGPNGPFKIGHGRSPRKRRMACQTGCWMKIELLFAVHVKNKAQAKGIEALAHRILCRYRLAGEWFACSYLFAMQAIHTACDVWDVEEDSWCFVGALDPLFDDCTGAPEGVWADLG
jgi:hypothetical protein